MRRAWWVGAILLFWLSGSQAGAQHYFEARGTNTKYRYVEWSYAFKNSAVVDLYYSGEPGSNEFDLGFGYNFQPFKSLTITPLVYAVIGKEAGQRGFQIAFQAAFESKGWRVNSFFGHYVRLSGGVSNYQNLDTLDVTRALSKRWEAGVSSGFLRAEGAWNPLIGPVAKFKDRLGSWAVSYRFGPEREFRVNRIFQFGKSQDVP
jgi:hypothetical protein